MSLSFVIPEFNINGTGTPTLQFYRRGFNLGGSGSQPTWKDIILSGNTALTLTNCKQNGLNAVRLFGGCEQSGTPTPTSPVDIVCNNGAIKYGALSTNLLDLANCTDGYYYTPAGAYTSAENARLSNYTPVKAGVAYTVSVTGAQGQSNVRLNLFDTEKNWLSQTVFVSYTGEKRTQTVTPTQDGFLAFSANYISSSRIDWNTAQVVQGSYTVETIPEYEPYREGIYTDGTVETVEVHTKNLFDKDSTPYQTGAYINSATVGNSSFQISAHSNYNIYRIDVQPNTTYTFGLIKANAPYWVVTDGSVILSCNPNGGDVAGTNITITTPANAKYLYLSVGVNGTYKCDDILQLELGSTATEYEPYYYGGQATAEMLLKVGDYQDVQSVLDGNVTRNVGVIVFDGTENWAVNSGTFTLKSIDLYQYVNFACICTHYAGASPQVTIASQPDKSIKAGFRSNPDNNRKFYLKDSSFTSTNDLQTWLAQQYANGTPVIVVFPLSEPTTETVTGQPLTIQEGTNIVEITQASMDNLELEVSYKAGVEVTVTEIENAQLDNSVEVTVNG